jgi:ATP-dependent RNA helicase DDX10/DBP4
MALTTADDSEDDDEEVLTVKRRHHDLQPAQDDDEQHNDGESGGLSSLRDKKKKGALSKVQAAKKVLKKKIVANTKVVFDEATGDAVADAGGGKASELGRQYESASGPERPGGGIDIATAREVLRAEDKFDKEAERRRAKERRRQAKLKAKEEEARKRRREGGEEGESDSDESVDLSWLPDPDKVTQKIKYRYSIKVTIRYFDLTQKNGSENGRRGLLIANIVGRKMEGGGY